MSIFIAREGEEIGECHEGDVAELVAEGQLLRSDLYWREGMEDWVPLGEFLDAASAPPVSETPKTETMPKSAPEAKAVEDRPPATTPPLPPELLREPEPMRARRRPRIEATEFPRQMRRPALAIGGVVLAIALVYFSLGRRAEHAAKRSALFQTGPTPAKVLQNADEVKDAASNDLRERIEKLPARAAPPLNTFYYDFSVNMRRSASPIVPWTAVIQGKEDVVAPETEKTIRHTDFILTAEYREGVWTFKHYRATVSDTLKNESLHIEENAETALPPGIVAMLRLKTQAR